jgi:hypothetical protein
MPVTYVIDPAKSLIHTKCIGDVNLQEIKDHFRELERDPNRPDRLNVLLDLSETTSVPNVLEVRVASNEVAKILRSVQFEACAIVVRNDLLFGMMRMFAAFASRYFTATQVFRATADAEVWLASQQSKPNPDQ